MRLFDIPESKSPRLRWMEKHDVKITKTGVIEIEECPETGMDVYPYYAIGGAIKGRGVTEDEAITQFAKMAGIKLWNEE